MAIISAHDVVQVSFPENFAAVSVEQPPNHLIEPLSQRELEVLQLISNGASNRDIAEELTISITTAKKHVSNIIRKLGVDNRTQAAAKGRNLDLCE